MIESILHTSLRFPCAFHLMLNPPRISIRPHEPRPLRPQMSVRQASSFSASAAMMRQVPVRSASAAKFVNGFIRFACAAFLILGSDNLRIILHLFPLWMHEKPPAHAADGFFRRRSETYWMMGDPVVLSYNTTLHHLTLPFVPSLHSFSRSDTISAFNDIPREAAIF